MSRTEWTNNGELRDNAKIWSVKYRLHALYPLYEWIPRELYNDCMLGNVYVILYIHWQDNIILTWNGIIAQYTG